MEYDVVSPHSADDCAKLRYHSAKNRRKNLLSAEPMNRIYQTSRRRYTAKEAAKLAGVAYSTIRKHIAEGKLPAKRDGRCLWIEADDLAELYPNFSEPPFQSAFDNADTADENAKTVPKSADESANTADESADREPNGVDKSATSEPFSDTEFKVELTLIRQERDHLRSEVEYLRQQALELSQSTRALTEQNERLTILLANEQAQRMKALPRPIGWIARLFRRHENA